MYIKWTTEVWGLLTSKRLALYLIMCLTLMLSGAMLLESDKLITVKGVLITPWVKSLGFDHVFSTWWFLTAVGLFFLNILACTIKQWQLLSNQTKSRVSGLYKQIKPMFVVSLSLGEELSPKIMSPRNIQVILRKFRYSTELIKAKDTVLVVGSKNRVGRWGSLIFHTSLLRIILGAIWGQVYKFNGQFFIVEGNKFFDRHSEYIQVKEGRLFAENHGQFNFFLHSIKTIGFNQYGVPDNLESDLTVSKPDGSKERVKVSNQEPYSFADYELYQFKHGYVPILGFRAKDSTKGYRITAILDSLIHEQSEEHLGKLDLPGTQLVARVKFFPDINGGPENPRAASYQLKNPGLFTTIHDGERLVYKGVVKPGDKIIFAGNTMEFLELKQWSGFSVNKDRGKIPVFIGFWGAIAGIFLIYFVTPKTVMITLTTDLITMVGKTGRFQALFGEELQSIRDDIMITIDE
ncbi:MAG: cytochrome c biogenesis protein ResB [Carboxydocellales bacterium]